MSYEHQTGWQDTQAFLPTAMHFTATYRPAEQWWSWRKHAIYLDRFRHGAARHKLIVLHGLGTNARLMSLLVGGPLWRLGYETVAVDLPGLGLSQLAPGVALTYEDWVRFVVSFVTAEMAGDPTPSVLVGLGTAGMLAYDAAVRSSTIRAVVGTCFQREPIWRDAVVARVVLPLAGLGALHLPLRYVLDMRRWVEHRDIRRIWLSDPTAARASMSARFLATFATYRRAPPPARLNRCPVLLASPARDGSSPPSVSERFLERSAGARIDEVVLPCAGHYPVEAPGLDALTGSIDRFVRSL